MVDNKKIKQSLFKKLTRENAFWSYDMKGIGSVPDDVLIAQSLIYLDIDDINNLFLIYDKEKIKKVWREKIVIQGDYYNDLNLLLSWLYFDIKKPDAYLKSVLTRHYKKIAKL